MELKLNVVSKHEETALIMGGALGVLMINPVALRKPPPPSHTHTDVQKKIHHTLSSKLANHDITSGILIARRRLPLRAHLSRPSWLQQAAGSPHVLVSIAGVEQSGGSC